VSAKIKVSMAVLSFKWLLVPLLSWFHPFYVSVTEIHHNAKDKTLEVSCKVFADDMEEVLKKGRAASSAIDLSNEKQKAQNDALIRDYVSKNLFLNAEGKAVKLSYVGFEKDKESVYCFFEVVNIPSLTKLQLTNSLLQDLNEEQINIMHVVVNGVRKSYKLDFPKKEATFSF
jgi:hypothetical protein